MIARALGATLCRRVGRDVELRRIRDLARERDAEAWLVGGYVRDTALGRRPHDLDLVAGRGATRLVPALSAEWGVRAWRFRKRGVTTWRMIVGPRRIDVVDAARRGLARDLRRRDLTINAIAYDLVRDRVCDPLGGLRDLRARRLRLASPSALSDDALRALRVARFLAQLPQFRATAATRRAARRAAPAAGRAAVERAREELDKLLCAADPRRGLRAIVDLALLEPLLPELTPLLDCRAGAGRPDVWTHTLDALALTARAARLPAGGIVRDPETRRILRWALLLHDISKPETLDADAAGRPTFHGHEVLGARRAESMLRRLRVAKRDRARIRALVLLHLRPGHLADAGAPGRGLRRLAREAGGDLPLLVLHAACDARASGSPDADRRWRRLRAVLRQLLELAEQAARAPLPRLLGGAELIDELGLEPGPLVGELLRAIREQQELGAVGTRDEAMNLARRLLERG